MLEYLFWIATGTLVVLLCGMLVFSDKGRRSIVLASRSLWLHKLRAFLSVLGIIIGTGSVITLMAFAEGSMQDALEDIKRQGATNVIIRSVKPPDESATAGAQRIAIYGLTRSDYEKLLTIPTVIRHVPMRVLQAQEVRYLEKKHDCRVVATTPGYGDVHDFAGGQVVEAGRFLTEDDGYKMLNVCVLGSDIAKKLIPYDNPLGKSIRLGKYFYRVVGVLGDRMPTGGTGGSQAAEEFNDDIYIPLETCNVRYGKSIFTRRSGSFSGEQVELSQVTLTVTDMDRVRPTGEIIKSQLKTKHTRQDWAVTVPLDRLEAAEREKNRYQRLMLAIASISLLVGGIGIMNIMLATVTERTREIGIRRALGAKRKDITLQFLIEAIFQTALGGLIGMFIGVGLVFSIPILTRWLAEVYGGTYTPAVLHVPAIFLALSFSIVVGVLFGLYPAIKASRLDPIEALRHE